MLANLIFEIIFIYFGGVSVYIKRAIEQHVKQIGKNIQSSADHRGKANR